MTPYQARNKKIAARFQFIQHAGKKILVLDYSHADHESCLALTAEFEAYLATLKPDGSLRVLFEMESPHYDPGHVNHWKSNSASHEKYFKATALVHVAPIFKVILNTMRAYLSMIGKPMNEKRGRVFEDKAAALDFLSKD